MKNDPIRAKVLATRIIANMDKGLREKLDVPSSHKSIGLITCDIDDVGYTAVDEATKKADVKVIYANSMYGGSGNASTKLAGEFIGVISAVSPEEVKAGLEAAKYFIENQGCFYSANEDDSIVYYAHCVSRTGSYLSNANEIEEGSAMAYLIAPPLEAIYALDKALKSANVEIKSYFAPPSNTNFGGAILTGSQSDCVAACSAFKEAVMEVAEKNNIV